MGQHKPPQNPATYKRPYDAERIAKIRAAFAKKSKAELKARAAKGNASMTPEQRSARTQKAWDTSSQTTRDTRLARTIQSTNSIQNRGINIKRGLQKLGFEWLSTRSQKRWDKMTARERKEATRPMREAWNALSSEQQSQLISEGLRRLSKKQRSAIVKRGWKNLTPLERDARIWHGIIAPARVKNRLQKLAKEIENKTKLIPQLQQRINNLRSEVTKYEHTEPPKARQILVESNELVIRKNVIEKEIEQHERDIRFWQSILEGYSPPIPRRTQDVEEQL